MSTQFNATSTPVWPLQNYKLVADVFIDFMSDLGDAWVIAHNETNPIAPSGRTPKQIS